MTGKKPSRLLPSSVQVHTSSGPWQQRGDCTCDLLEPKLSALSFSQKGMSLMTFVVRREGKDKAEGNVKEGIVGGTGSLWYPWTQLGKVTDLVCLLCTRSHTHSYAKDLEIPRTGRWGTGVIYVSNGPDALLVSCASLAQCSGPDNPESDFFWMKLYVNGVAVLV